MKMQYLVIPVSNEKQQFFDTALREEEMGILSNEALKPGGVFWNDDEQT